MAQVIPPRNDMNAFYQNGPSVNLFGYTPYPFETVAAAAAAAAAQAAVIAVVAIMLCGIAHMEAWHDHHNILNLNEGDIQNNVVAYTPASCQTGTSKPQVSEPNFLYSVLKFNHGANLAKNFYRPGYNYDIYRADDHNLPGADPIATYNAWLEQFDQELRERYIICSVTLDKNPGQSIDNEYSKIQACFVKNGIDADLFICRDVAYGNVAYDIRRWGGDTTVYNVQTREGVYDPGPSVSYLSDAGIKCGYQDVAGVKGVPVPPTLLSVPTPVPGDNGTPLANGKSRYGLFNDSIANENTTVYSAFTGGIMVSPEEMMFSQFKSQLFGENWAQDIYGPAAAAAAAAGAAAGAAVTITKATTKQIIDSSQVNLVVEYGQTPQGQERLYLVTKHSSSKATSMLNLPFICSCLKYSAAVDAIDIASASYDFPNYLMVNQSGPLKIMTKKFGDSGIALQTLRDQFDFFSFEPINAEPIVNLVPRKSNGVHCFLSYDQVAIGSALEYGCPVVMYNVNDVGGVAGGVLLFISKKIQNKFSNPDNIRIELNYKITMALASVNQQAIQTQYAAAVGTPDVPGLWNNPTNPTSVPSITATLGILQTNMNTMQTTLSGWNSSGQNAQFDIWYQNYLRLGSIIAKHTSRLKGVVKLRDIFETNYAQIITTGTAADTIATSAVITDYANNGNAADVIANAAIAAIAIANGNVADADAAAAAAAADVIDGNDVNLNTAFVNAVAAAAIDPADFAVNLKVSNVILTVILEKINAVIQLTSQINKINDTLKIINDELLLERRAIIPDPNNVDMIKSFNKKVKFTHDKILDRCNPFMGLGKAQRGRSFVNKLTSCNGTDPNAVELGLVIIKQCFDNLNDDLYLDQFQIEIKNLFNTFYNVANIKGLKPNYKLALDGIPDDYKDKFMGQPLLDQYNNNIDPMTFGGREAVQEPITTNLLETKAHAVELKTQKQEAAQASVPIAEELTKQEAAQASVPTAEELTKQEAAQASVPTAEELTKREAATAEEFKKQKEKMKELLSKVDASITIMTDGTKPKMVDAKTLQDKAKESITLAIKENSYAELSDAQIATYERADSMVKGLDALKNILEMVQKFIQVEGTKYIEHSNKPDSYEFLQARMCLYQVFFVSSFLQTLHQYQTTKTTKKQIKDGKSEKTDGKSGGGERSNIQIGGLGLDRQAAFIAQFKMIAADNGRLPVLQDFTNDLFTFDMKATPEKLECKQEVQGILSNNPQSIVYFRMWLVDGKKLWYFSMHNASTGGQDLSLSTRPPSEWDQFQVAEWFNNTFIFAYGYVMTMTHYDAIINYMVTLEINTESTKLHDDDILEATFLPPRVTNDQGTIEELDIINTTPDEGGDILEMIFGEENSPKYSSSLAKNGGLYRYIAILANATQDIREHVVVNEKDGFSIVPTIIGERSWLAGQDITSIEHNLRGFLSPGGGAQFDTSNLVQQEVVGGTKKTKRTKKRRNKRKHTKKMKFRKAPKSKKHRKTKRKGK